MALSTGRAAEMVGGAYEGTILIGLAIAERRAWNRSLWVREICVAATHRRRGTGGRLVDELSRRARDAGLRVLVCETKTTNSPAIDFCRSIGFTLHGVDVSYYTNHDIEKGEVAIFLKKHITPRRPSSPKRRRTRRQTSR